MRLLRTMLAVCAAVLGLAACDPQDGVSEADYQYHKANRDAYLYQGI